MRNMIALIAVATCAFALTGTANAQLSGLSLLNNKVQVSVGNEHTNAGLAGLHLLGRDHALALQVINLGPDVDPLDLELGTPYDEDIAALLGW